MKRLLIPGASHLTVAEKRLSASVQDWGKKWCAYKEPRPAGVFTASAATCSELERYPVLVAGATSSAGDVWLLSPSAEWHACLWGPLRDILPFDEMGVVITKAATSDFLSTIFAALGAPEHTAVASFSMAAAGKVMLQFQLQGVEFVLCVDAALLPVTLMPSSARTEKLEPCAGALSHLLVDVHVELPLMKLSATDFIGLKPGDVLGGTAGLDTSFQVRIEESQLPLKASLGFLGTKKAVKLESL